MAKKEETPKTVLERMYNIPLRREFQKVAKWRRTEKAVSSLRSFISKHMKSDNVVLSKYVNQSLWKNGIKNPPHHLKVNASKDEKGKVIVELAELPAKAKRELEEQKKIDKKKEEKEAEKKKEEEAKKKAEEAKKAEEKKEESKKEETAKKVEKEEIKELKKELPKQQAPKQEAIQKQVEQRPSAPKQQ
jgi:ribosomal protein L31E|tara:strand:- start:3628 stop:4194 length:567 start_codon:yes stop_codon:yes gene_type:complete